jgi:hypothetical protein
MKTLTDLLELIAKETELSKGKLVEYRFSLDMIHNWLSMVQVVDLVEETKETPVFEYQKIETVAELQLAYWLIWTNGRSKHEDTPENAPRNAPEKYAVLIPVNDKEA